MHPRVRSFVKDRVTHATIFRNGEFPRVHNDPFDRLLAAQALKEDLQKNEIGKPRNMRRCAKSAGREISAVHPFRESNNPIKHSSFRVFCVFRILHHRIWI
jgi:hypothetical protein